LQEYIGYIFKHFWHASFYHFVLIKWSGPLQFVWYFNCPRWWCKSCSANSGNYRL